MRRVEIAGDAAIVDGGATVNDLLEAATMCGRSAVVGTVDSVGVAGLTVGGGYGMLIGIAGLAVDNCCPRKSCSPMDRSSQPTLPGSTDPLHRPVQSFPGDPFHLMNAP